MRSGQGLSFRGMPAYLRGSKTAVPVKKWGLQMSSTEPENNPVDRKLKIFNREFALPRSRKARIAMGIALVFFGCLGFLPVLGFWMIPLGLLVLSYEFARVRRLRRRSIVWWERRRGRVRVRAVPPSASAPAARNKDDPGA